MQAALRVGVKGGCIRAEVFHQVSAMRAAFVRIADGIDVQDNAIKAQPAPQAIEHDDLLGVDIGTVEPQRFGVELVELSVTALLWTFVPEHGPRGPYALRAFVSQIVLDRGTDDAGGRFRTQRQAFTIEPILERVHLVLDDVGDLADRAHEQRCRLDQRHLHVAIPVLRHDIAHCGVELQPQRRRVGQHVVHAAHGLNHAGHNVTRRP